MGDAARYKELFERSKKAVTLRPAIGQETMSTVCRVDPSNLAADILAGGWTVRTDAHEEEGGTGEAPSPGVLLRGALAACCAMDVVIRAAVHGVPVDGVEVEIQADFDAQGAFGLADVSPGYTGLRYIVTVESSAPEAEVMAVLDEIDQYGHLLNVVRRPLPVSREVRITAPIGA
jgi:uncharacterized OsmC-like protein